MNNWTAIARVNGAILIKNRANSYIAYNPYSRKIAKFEMENFDVEEVKHTLSANGFSLKKEKIDRNISITFSVSDKCNLDCIYCFSGNKSGTVASFENASKALQDFFNRKDLPKHPTIAFFGSGEPFVNFEFIKNVVSTSKKLGIKKGIDPRFLATSNCVFSKKILDFIIKNTIYISASVDGPPEIQDAQRPLLNGDGSSKVVMKNIKSLIDHKMDFHLRTTITSQTVTKMADMVQYWAVEGVKKLYLEPVALTGSCKENAKLRSDPTDFAFSFLEALNVARKKGVSINTEAVRKLRTGSDRYFCPAIAGDNILFTTDGRRSFCYEDLAPESSGHFVPDKQAKLYDSAPIPGPLENINWPPRACVNCHIAGACGSTCPRRAYHTNGDFSVPYLWQCKLNKLLIPEVIAVIAEQTTF